jgi:DNA-directed RNA polymerase specialized sigma24 family protein
MNEELLAEISHKLELYNDIPAFIRIHSKEIDELSRFGPLTGASQRIEELQSKIKEYLDLRREVEEWLLLLPKIQREILRLKYFEDKEWRQIEGTLQCKGYNIRIRQLQNHRNEAIQTISNNLTKGGKENAQ